MKRLMIGLVLAVFLVGCEAGEKSKFSISENDTLETYANNPAFIKTVSNIPDKGVAYKFTSAPISMYGGIKTSDLDVLGGYVALNNKKPSIERGMMLTLKGKASFDKLLDRINQSDYIKDMNCSETAMERGHQLVCSKSKTNARGLLINYNPFTDAAILTIQYF